jgi:hypothetical protein
MKAVKTYGIQVTIFIIMIAAIMLRLYLYGDPRLSIGMGDTISYIQSSRAPVLSWASMTGRRLLTMNLVYHIFVKDPNNCPVPVMIDPSKQRQASPELQSCFDMIALLQNLLSMIGWSLLAWVMSSRVKTSLYKILITIIILSFAMSPQIAEWDNILSSESLTLSLLVICLALLIEIAFQLFEDQNENKGKNYILLAGWLIVFTLWIFVQDANLYFVPITLILLIPFIIIGHLKNKALLIASLFMIGILALGLISSANSTRWQPSIEHSYEKFIFPYPSRINSIKGLGAPDPNSPNFTQWFGKKAPSVYLLFLASHPGFVTSNMFEHMYMFTSDYLQPYFTDQNVKFSSALMTWGKIFHPESSDVFLMDTLLLGFLCYTAAKNKEKTASIWAWIGAWLYISSAAALFIRYFGDTESVLRHVFPAVEFFRLLVWILLIVQADLLTMKGNQ